VQLLLQPGCVAAEIRFRSPENILDEIEEKDWNLVVDVNLTGTFRVYSGSLQAHEESNSSGRSHHQ
jgi:NAD(P)-dependent dehydrogenase (short-subunit alcohol dehydrogenase family)